jgi:hypothetical protein
VGTLDKPETSEQRAAKLMLASRKTIATGAFEHIAGGTRKIQQ